MPEELFHELPEINPTNSNRHQSLLHQKDSLSTEDQEGGQNYEYWKREGDRLRVAKAYLEAIGAYDSALLQKPTACYAWQQRGEVFKRLQRYEEAIASYRKALEVSVNPIARYQAWNGLGALFFTLERYEESIFAYKQALALCPNSMGSPHILEMEGIAWSRLNRYLEAHDCYDRAYHKAVEISDKTAKTSN
ncbi:tetratricopeptide repeat protein [Oscillatoria acuminata PCC 6304]|uniref:Tetratricopeptide repeat protein n=1 Tax=Oscillatoria acuminata PCC 6304 TaxID=56110 RepID=K9TMA1_9CYAN|nr:tetratricopeptide repeat protein [Oscillatoria acuminata PCC 6304]